MQDSDTNVSYLGTDSDTIRYSLDCISIWEGICNVLVAIDNDALVALGVSIVFMCLASVAVSPLCSAGPSEMSISDGDSTESMSWESMNCWSENPPREGKEGGGRSTVIGRGVATDDWSRSRKASNVAAADRKVVSEDPAE